MRGADIAVAELAAEDASHLPTPIHTSEAAAGAARAPQSAHVVDGRAHRARGGARAARPLARQPARAGGGALEEAGQGAALPRVARGLQAVARVQLDGGGGGVELHRDADAYQRDGAPVRAARRVQRRPGHRRRQRRRAARAGGARAAAAGARLRPAAARADAAARLAALARLAPLPPRRAAVDAEPADRRARRRSRHRRLRRRANRRLPAAAAGALRVHVARAARGALRQGLVRARPRHHLVLERPAGRGAILRRDFARRAIRRAIL